MHNLKDIRDNFDKFKKKMTERFSDINIDEILKLDKENRQLIQSKEKNEQEKKILSKNKDPKNFDKSKNISKVLKEITEKQIKTQKKILSLLSNLPNIAKDDVPIGKDDTSNKVLEKFGNPPNFKFKIRSHVELGQDRDFLDFETSNKLSGSRFSILKDKFALLERGLINLMLDIHTKKFGYIEISPPLIVKQEIMYGTGQLPKFEQDQYEIKNFNDEKKYLIPTAEVVLTNIIRNKILKQEELPIRYVASTPCFRKEAGSYGKDTKGLMRQHQFYKVELVSIVKPEETDKELIRMISCAEEILKILNLSFRKVLLSSGDMGFSAEKTIDLEVWIPSENKYREISSCSSCGTFQARRMNAKFKNNEKKEFLATLNGSGLAVGRLIIALLENNQNEDGTINIPKELQKYIDNKEKI